MLDFDAHAQFADATAELMRSCALATAQTMTTSACRGLTLWSDMLRPPVRRAASTWARESIANPFETFWRLSSAGWMPRAQTSPISNWMPGNGSLQAWNPYAAVWRRSPYASWAPLGDWASWSSPYYWPAWNLQPAAGLFAAPAAMSQAALRHATSSAYASYRSPGGHAVAQIIAPVSDTVIAGLTATAVYTQMQTMLGAWRAALGG